MKSKFSPPTVPEWHSAVVGFGSGFAFGAGDDSDVATVFVRAVLRNDDETGHLAQAQTEVAYALACYVVGAVVGRAWSRSSAATGSTPSDYE
jgi:hypothetical protein